MDRAWQRWGNLNSTLFDPILASLRYIGYRMQKVTQSVGIISSSRFIYNQKKCVAKKENFVSSVVSRADGCDRGGRPSGGEEAPPSLRVVATPSRSISESWVPPATEHPGGERLHLSSSHFSQRLHFAGRAARADFPEEVPSRGTLPVPGVRGHCCSCGRGAASRAPRRPSGIC